MPLTFSLRILGDGLGPPSVSYEDHLSDMSRNNPQVVAAEDKRERPAEFTINPSSGCLSPQSHVLVEVESVSYTHLDLYRKFPFLMTERKLVVNM